jgi:hypothetical protein
LYDHAASEAGSKRLHAVAAEIGQGRLPTGDGKDQRGGGTAHLEAVPDSPVDVGGAQAEPGAPLFPVKELRRG